MPQINFYTYLSQTTWTIIIFYIFYYSMKQYFLPLIFQNLKVKSIILQTQNKETLVKSSSSILQSYYYSYNNLLSNTST